MDLTFITEFYQPLVVVICLAVGYILKNVVPTDKINKYIPLIMGVLGVILAVWISGAFTPLILAVGLVSGLASTGMHELFKNLIEK
jgi:hypothetical protein